MANNRFSRNGSIKSRNSIKYRSNFPCGTPIRAGWGVFSEYADSSTIHGVRYLTEPKRPLSERVWWIIAFCLSLYGCVSFILVIWNKWEKNPVIISFADQLTPVWQIPFPAITICPQTKSKSQFLNFTENYHTQRDSEKVYNMSEETLGKLQAIFHICEPESSEEFGSNFTTGKECVDNLIQVAPTLDDMFWGCMGPNSTYGCSRMFTETVTDIGVCYTANMLSPNELLRTEELQTDYIYYNHTSHSTNWSLETGYSNVAPLKTYPMRVLSANKRDALEIFLGGYDYDYLCSGLIQGFKILFRTPSDFPQFSKNFHHVLLDGQVFFSLVPKITKTSSGLLNYLPSKRKCFYNKDRHLKFFKVYTKQNCELECIANYTLSKCGCVKFSMPSSQGTSICGTKSIECYRNAEYEIATNQQKQILLKDENSDEKDCNCLPACSSIVYNTEIAHYDLNFDHLLKALKIDKSEMPKGLKWAHVVVSFKDVEFISTKRSELYGPTDFVANCGGLLGLFMGVSLLSVVEIIYFCTIRIFSNFRMKRRCRSASMTDGMLTPRQRNFND